MVAPTEIDPAFLDYLRGYLCDMSRDVRLGQADKGALIDFMLYGRNWSAIIDALYYRQLQLEREKQEADDHDPE